MSHSKTSKKSEGVIDLSQDIIIGCPSHGDFICNAQAHLEGYGCPDCKIEDIETKLINIYNRLETFIVHFESANSESQDVPTSSYRMIAYEVSDGIKNLLEEKKIKMEVFNYNKKLSYEDNFQTWIRMNTDEIITKGILVIA